MEKPKELNLNNRINYTSKIYDTTIIEINPDKDGINTFLELNENIILDGPNKFYLNESIYIMHYPDENLSVSYGILNNIFIDEINKFKFSHLCSTKEGSSGSPIMNLSNGKIIGIHQGSNINHNFNEGIFLNYPLKDFLKNNQTIKELKIIGAKKKEIIKRNIQNNNRPDKSKDTKEKIREMIEDICFIGNIMKKEIIEEKKYNPEKFITIEEALNNIKEEYDYSFSCLGILAKYLENIGVITVINKNILNNNDGEIDVINLMILQFIITGMIEKKKYNFIFDFGKKRNEELFNNKKEQEKLNNMLKKVLSLEYEIKEDNILLINNIEKDNLEIQTIFLQENKNEINIDKLNLIQKYKNIEEFKDLNYLQEIRKTLIMEGCKLNINMLDPRGNKFDWSYLLSLRGPFLYNYPIGWKAFGFNVWNKYDMGNCDWVDISNLKNEWVVGYCPIQANQKENNKKDNIIGTNIHCSPYPEHLKSNTNLNKIIKIDNKLFMIGFMIKANPDSIRIYHDNYEYWILNGIPEELRPFRIMIQEYNEK